MLSNSVCNHTRDETNQTLTTQPFNFVNYLYDCRPNWSPLSPITIVKNFVKQMQLLEEVSYYEWGQLRILSVNLLIP